MFTSVRKAVVRVANTSKQETHLLPALERSLLPVLAATSFLYGYILAFRCKLYQWRILKQTRLPLPVISIGNISWGGNGKTPMAEYLASKFLECAIPPILLTRGYGGGDEVKLLEGHLQGTQAKIGVGRDRVEAAKAVFKKHGVRGIRDIHRSIEHLNFHKNHKPPHDLSHMDMAKLAPHGWLQPQTGSLERKIGFREHKDGMGIILLDDGMQHQKVGRDIEIVMVNAVSEFGNGSLVPRGPLREPLEALCRADIVVIHHANLVPLTKVNSLKEKLQSFLPTTVPIVCTEMVPHSLVHIKKDSTRCIGKGGVRKGPNLSAPLSVLKSSNVLCISGIGCPESLMLTLQQLGVLFIERMDFPDHHHFKVKDFIAIKQRLHELKTKLENDPVIVSTEKDYARSPDFFWRLEDYEVYILRSTLEIMDDSSSAEDFSSLIVSKLQRWLG
ncbi:hypothetical protein GOP47_0024573 [Adiantum capillus-veneris]|uniref:tetraacyldisaccharide 4'-kinase n=1 Tax=Adiantum capillus-veneris TaxID=13818 RepID=A0A9D4U361_ADICA|nr:hypothetical protein GOP47_0024573 [Adiantum capillus-veneris]